MCLCVCVVCVKYRNYLQARTSRISSSSAPPVASVAAMRAGTVKGLDDEEADDAGGSDAQTGLPPQQRVAGHEAEMFQMAADECNV